MHQSGYAEMEPLDFSEASEIQIKAWLGKLLKLDFSSALSHLCDALDEFVWANLKAEARWSIAEIIRAAAYTLLTRRLNVIDIMTEEQYRTFEQTQQALMSLQLIKRAIVKAGKGSPDQDKDLPAKALHRAMADSANLLLLCYTRHQPVPESLWREIHLLYKQARSLKVQDFEWQDKTISRDKVLSIEGI